MGERRRYPAPDLERARRRLRADAEGLAELGLRPTWMVWVPARRRWWRRRRGELVVQFEPAHRRTAGDTSLASVLLPLTWRLQQLVERQRMVRRSLEELGEDPDADLHATRRRLESAAREVELELRRLESLR